MKILLSLTAWFSYTMALKLSYDQYAQLTGKGSTEKGMFPIYTHLLLLKLSGQAGHFSHRILIIWLPSFFSKIKAKYSWLVANQIGFSHKNSHSGCNRPTRCLNELELVLMRPSWNISMKMKRMRKNLFFWSAAKVLSDLVCNRPVHRKAKI